MQTKIHMLSVDSICVNFGWITIWLSTPTATIPTPPIEKSYEISGYSWLIIKMMKVMV